MNPRIVRTALVALGVGGVAYVAYRWFRRGSPFRKSSEFLCDTCSYGSRRVCERREFPNATVCDDYRSKLV